MWHWNNRSQNWVVYTSGLIDSYGHYGICGPYGSCNINRNPPCSRMEDRSNGCKLQSPLDCKGGDAFRKVIKMKFLNTRHSW
uniref:S-locus glycoprotein domain-containing protein n=1 Tax=Lactuca sativa TaxID=4236 RepID=A0A9R1X8Z9_LACSA|nr:hypothetical protein LSAT_V11C600340530 [Lactuca sativa]